MENHEEFRPWHIYLWGDTFVELEFRGLTGGKIQVVEGADHQDGGEIRRFLRFLQGGPEVMFSPLRSRFHHPKKVRIAELPGQGEFSSSLFVWFAASYPP